MLPPNNFIALEDEIAETDPFDAPLPSAYSGSYSDVMDTTHAAPPTSVVFRTAGGVTPSYNTDGVNVNVLLQQDTVVGALLLDVIEFPPIIIPPPPVIDVEHECYDDNIYTKETCGVIPPTDYDYGGTPTPEIPIGVEYFVNDLDSLTLALALVSSLLEYAGISVDDLDEIFLNSAVQAGSLYPETGISDSESQNLNSILQSAAIIVQILTVNDYEAQRLVSTLQTAALPEIAIQTVQVESAFLNTNLQSGTLVDISIINNESESQKLYPTLTVARIYNTQQAVKAEDLFKMPPSLRSGTLVVDPTIPIAATVTVTP